MTTAPQFLIGADPELFVAGRDGRPMSVHDIIPGSKKAPHKVASGAIQPDGLAAEFNIDPVPVSDFAAFDTSILAVIGEVKQRLPEGATILRGASTMFDKDYYDSLPDEVKVLGCEPDYCAYSTDIFAPNPRPDGDSGLRSAAGHIHIGWGADIPADHPEHLEVCRKIVRQMDWYVGLAMTIIDPDTERRKLYGKAGAYRPKSYGVEYRTPSNAWLWSKGLRRFIHQMVNRAITDMVAQRVFEDIYNSKYRDTYPDVQSIINNGDATAARSVLEKCLNVRIPDFTAKAA